jgi:hypothetical protein
VKPLDKHPELRNAVTTVRIIVIALCLGLGGFLGYTVYLRLGQEPSDDMLLPWVAVALLGVLLPIRMVLRAVTMGKARETYNAGDEGQFRQRYQSAIIIQGALVEGPGFLGCVAYLLTGQWIALAVAGACLLALIVLIPTEASVNRLLDDLP